MDPLNVTRSFDLTAGVDSLPSDHDIDKDSPRPDLARPAIADMREAAKLPDALLGGNRRMRRESDEWLPKEEEESDTNYRIRVGRSTCFPFYRDTLLDLAARPFGRDVGWDAEPAAGNAGFAEFLRDMDGTGKTLTVFARDLLFHGMHRGMDHVLVDASSKSGATRATTDGRRVYAQRIDALSMLDVRDTADETAEANRYFGVGRFAGRAYYGGNFDGDNDANYVYFQAGDLQASLQEGDAQEI